MKVLVTGANGFIGTHLCRALVHAGYRVKGAVWKRDIERPLVEGVEKVTVDSIDAETRWSSVLTGTDAVIHLAARVHVSIPKRATALEKYRRTNVEGTRRLALEAQKSGVVKFIHMSSIKAVGEGYFKRKGDGNEEYEEDTPCRPSDPYGISKLEAESTLLEEHQATDMSVFILRPPLVYGPDVRANFLRMMKIIDRGWPLPLGRADNLRSLIYVRNLTSAILGFVNAEKVEQGIYHVADKEILSSKELITIIAEAMGKHARIIPCPTGFVYWSAKLFGFGEEADKILKTLVLSTRKVQDQLGWFPPFSARDGLSDTVRWYKSVGNNR